MKAQSVYPPAAGASEPEGRLQRARVSCFPGAREESSAPRSRRMLLLERTMYRDGLVPFSSLFTLRLRGELSEPRLREALAQIQGKHPLLRCEVEVTTEVSRFILRDRPVAIPLRIRERNTDCDWEGEARREWVMPFGKASGPLVRLVWLRGTNVHELILVGHHCICDGPSCLALLRDCFAAYDNPEWEPDAYEALGSIEDLLPMELSQDRGFRFRVRRRSMLIRLALLMKRRRRPAAHRLPGSDAMYFHRWQVDSVNAQALQLRCREENVTVLAAVAVAVLQAFRSLCGPRALRHAYAMVNGRKFMTPPHPDALFGVAPGVEIGIRHLPDTDAMPACAFWETARAIRKDLTRRIGRLSEQYFESMAALETLHDLYPKLIRDTDSASDIRHVTFSNLGKLDLPQNYRSFSVEQVFSPLVMVSPSPANTVVLSSFGGVMEFAIISDDSSLPQTQARAVGERAMAILRSAVVTDVRCASDKREEPCARGTR